MAITNKRNKLVFLFFIRHSLTYDINCIDHIIIVK